MLNFRGRFYKATPAVVFCSVVSSLLCDSYASAYGVTGSVDSVAELTESIKGGWYRGERCRQKRRS